MDNLIEKIFDEIIIEAESGIIYSNIEVKFHTLNKYNINSSYNDCIPILVIKNKRELINKLKQYMELVSDTKKIELTKENMKKSISLLLANACYEDFSNPVKFIENHINFYLNTDFMDEEIIEDDLTLKRTTQSFYNETPYAFKSSIKEYDTKYFFPNINYGISEDVCYIYNLEQTTKNQSKEFTKEIESKYNVYLLVLTLILDKLYKSGITKIKVISFLPMRYNTLEKKEEVEELLSYFISLTKIFNNIKITSCPFEQDEYMNIEISSFDKYDIKKTCQK